MIDKRFTKSFFTVKQLRKCGRRYATCLKKNQLHQVTTLQRKLHNLKLGSNEKINDDVAEVRNVAALAC